MAEINRLDGRPVIDYMARDYESLLRSMYSMVGQKLPEWRDFSNEADFGNVLLELFAHIGDILSYYQDRVANESFLGTARTRRSVIEHLRLIGYELGTAAPASTSLALAVPAGVTKKVTVKPGDAFATKSQKDRPSVRFEYTRRSPIEIDFATVPVDQGTGRKVFTGLPVEQGRLFAGEVLGVSDGRPNQRFPLAHAGVILRPPGAALTGQDVVLVTTLAGVVQTWTLQESLAFSQAAQPDFSVQLDAEDRATVVFGDDTFGAVPPSGATVTATYRVGGGTVGNVPAGSIVTVVDAPALALLGAVVTNPEPAVGGADREDIDHAVKHAPAVFRSLRRAVTASDYEQIALGFQGVGKVRAVPTGWNEVTLHVAPEQGGKVSDVLEANLKSYFENKRMLSQIVEISDVDYVPVLVTAEIAVESFYVPQDVLDQVRAAAGRLLAFDQVDFGQSLYLSKFYEQCQEVPGVVFVTITEFRRDDAYPAPPDEPPGTITLGPNEIPVVPPGAEYASGIRLVLVPRVG